MSKTAFFTVGLSKNVLLAILTTRYFSSQMLFTLCLKIPGLKYFQRLDIIAVVFRERRYIVKSAVAIIIVVIRSFVYNPIEKQ